MGVAWLGGVHQLFGVASLYHRDRSRTWSLRLTYHVFILGLASGHTTRQAGCTPAPASQRLSWPRRHHPAPCGWVWEGVGGCGWVCPSGRPINHPWAERTNKRQALWSGRVAVLGGEVWGGAGGGREGGQNSSQRVETEMQEVRGTTGSARSVPREAGTGPDPRAPCPRGLLHTPLPSGGAITLKHAPALPCACLQVCFSLYYLHFQRL